MDKLNEFFKDTNNRIMAIGAVVVLVVLVIVVVMMSGGKKETGSSSLAPVPGASGSASTPGSTASTPGMGTSPSMPGMGTSPMMGGGMNPNMSGGTNAVASVPAPETNKVYVHSKPLEPGRFDPFAPVGVKKVSATKTFGDKVRLNIPSSLQAVAFTDFDFSYVGKPIPVKSKAEIEYEKRQKSPALPKPTNIRLSGIMTSDQKVAFFEIVGSGGYDNKAKKVGEVVTTGYDANGEKYSVKLKSIDSNHVILVPTKGKPVEWKFQITSGNSNMGSMSGMGTGMGSMPGMGTGMGSMPGMGTGMGSMPGMGTGMGSMPGMGTGMGSMPGMGTGMGSMPGMGSSPMMPTMPGLMSL